MIPFAPSSRIMIREAEWVVRRVDSSSVGGQQLTCEGISELVQEAIFLSQIEDPFEVLLTEGVEGFCLDIDIFLTS